MSKITLRDQLDFPISPFLQEEKQTAGEKEATDLLGARSSCDMASNSLWSRIATIYRDARGGWRTSCSLVMFFSSLGPSTVARCARLSKQ